MTGARIHGYEILGEIGVGGMSRVYLAKGPKSLRQAAIKLLPSEYLNDLGFRARFEQEAQVIAALAHPAIVPIYEFGVYQGQPFIVMQYMSKGSLAERLARGPLPPDRAVETLARIANALDFTHRQGIIHRDLKPSNILYDQNDDAYLADFGIAARAGATWQQDLAGGTPAYMSPEQALQGETIDSRSDVYSLGIIAFEMLTGGLPFEGDLPVSVVLKHIYDPPPSLGAANPDLPAALDPVLQRALAKDPRERYPSTGEFSKAFESALHEAERQPPEVDLEQSGVSSQQVQMTFLAPAGDAPPGETALPATRPNKPVFPDFSNLSARRSHFGSKPRHGYYVLAVGLVTWMAVLLAAITAFLARAQELFPASNIEIVYDDSALAVVNTSIATIDLTGVVFQRISDQGNVTAAFPVEQWGRVASGALRSLPAGDCFQLLRYGSKNYPLTPGAAPAKPPSCSRSQGWLVTTDQAWNFWTGEGARFQGSGFQIVQAGRVIHVCRAADGKCDFFLPKKN